MNSNIRDILMSVRNPYRYAGGEVGSIVKDWNETDARICLAFPDVYEIGMSHLGLSILYHIINDQPRMLAERVFAPWMDMEATLEERGMPLFSLESHRPLSDFDIIGFSLSYELTYTNVLTMLKLSGIPWRAMERGENHPLIIAGGPCAFNPMPVAPFFDAIVIGDGEGAIVEIANVVGERKQSGGKREELLDRLSLIRGVYVPAVHGFDFEQRAAESENPAHPEPVEGCQFILRQAQDERGFPSEADVPRPSSLASRLSPALSGVEGSLVPRPSAFSGVAHVPNLDLAPFPRAPIVPHAATHERVAVEVSRGCARGCRFCQAGYIYRPVRQRSASNASKIACDGITYTGGDEFSFLSLSIGDWLPLEGALESVHESLKGQPVNASLPSLRAESLSCGIVSNLGVARAGSFTIAPETATERMRKLINKGNTDDDLYSSVEKVFKNGWHAIKLYFMIGLPEETDAEIEGIIKIANRCLDIGRRHHRRPEVTVSTSTFVPKAHTPFQWEGQISMEETARIQGVLKKSLHRPGLYYRWHDAGMSFLEGVFSRGDSKLSRAIEIAHENGARFDGWDENFNLERWLSSLKEAGLDPEDYLRARDEDTVFPWDFLGVGPSREFLLRERERADALEFTEDCTTGQCSACGICDFVEVKNCIASNERQLSCFLPHASCFGSLRATNDDVKSRGDHVALRERRTTNHEPRTTIKFRLTYRKTGRSSFLGPIETLDALRRSFRSASLNICYTEGYHPRAKVSSGPALQAGIESEAEFVDITLDSSFDTLRMSGKEGEIVKRLAGRLPEGMDVVGASLLPTGAPSIEEGQKLVRYEVSWEEGPDPAEVKRRFDESTDITVKRIRGVKETEVNLKDYVDELAVLGDKALRVLVRNIHPALKISEALRGIFGVEGEAVKGMRVRKTGVVWRDDEA